MTEKAVDTIVTYAVGDDGPPGDPVASPSEGVTRFGFDFGRRSRLLASTVPSRSRARVGPWSDPGRAVAERGWTGAGPGLDRG